MSQGGIYSDGYNPYDEPDNTEDQNCPECKGKGCIRFDQDGNDLTEEQYNQLPEDKRFCDECTHCYGVGKIQVEI